MKPVLGWLTKMTWNSSSEKSMATMANLPNGSQSTSSSKSMGHNASNYNRYYYSAVPYQKICSEDAAISSFVRLIIVDCFVVVFCTSFVLLPLPCPASVICSCSYIAVRGCLEGMAIIAIVIAIVITIVITFHGYNLLNRKIGRIEWHWKQLEGELKNSSIFMFIYIV